LEVTSELLEERMTASCEEPLRAIGGRFWSLSDLAGNEVTSAGDPDDPIEDVSLSSHYLLKDCWMPSSVNSRDLVKETESRIQK
jgi:hypothetical protein